MKRKKLSMQDRKKWITMFMIIIFSICLAATSEIKELMTRLVLQVLLFAGQLLIVKSLLDDYFRE